MPRFAVIGLGNFGFYVVKSLYEMGFEVLAVDRNKNTIQHVKDVCTRAALAEATEKEALETLGVGEMDVAVVSVGGRIDTSILIALHLKELGVEKVVVKAVTEDHGKILGKLGVSMIVFPEKEMAGRVATRLINPNLIDYIPLAPGYGIVELAPPGAFVGKTLEELHLRRNYGIQVIAAKRQAQDELVMIPSGDFHVSAVDTLIVVGTNEELEKLQKLKE